MHVHLALPGLLWPARALPDLTYDLDLPALSWLLGRGRTTLSNGLAVEHWLVSRFGHGVNDPPLAALRLLGEDEASAPGSAHWICADPVYLDFEHGQPILADPVRLELQPGEIAEIAAVVAPILSAVGSFRLSPSGRGYLELARPVELHGEPLSSAVGRGIAAMLPRGDDAHAWLRLANDVQIALHALKCNRKREEQGLPTVNSLWFWGAGALAPARPVPYARVGGGSTVARGCARHAGIPWETGINAAPPTEPTLRIDERLQGPMQQLDAEGWREALRGLDRELLAPHAAALRAGRIRRLTLSGLGDDATLDVDISRGDTLRFWRRPRRLEEVVR